MKRVRIVVSGRVQGVFFRDTVRRLAEEQGVGGWVRNRPDGSVEAVLEGAPEPIERLVAFCHRGPSGAEVHSVESFEESPEGLVGFAVR